MHKYKKSNLINKEILRKIFLYLLLILRYFLHEKNSIVVKKKLIFKIASCFFGLLGLCVVRKNELRTRRVRQKNIVRKYCIFILYLRIIVFNEFMAIMKNKNGFLFACFGRNLHFLLCIFGDYAASLRTIQEVPKNVQ